MLARYTGTDALDDSEELRWMWMERKHGQVLVRCSWKRRHSDEGVGWNMKASTTSFFFSFVLKASPVTDTHLFLGFPLSFVFWCRIRDGFCCMV